MPSLQDSHITDLLWIQPNRKSREYELQAGDDSVLRVRWENKHGAKAIAESEAGTWEIDTHGILRPRVFIQLPGSTANLATFRGTWDGGGTLEFRDGRSYAWKNTNFLHTAWAWTNRQGQPLLRFKGKQMTLEPAGRTLPEISLLAALSWYRTIMNKQASDSGAAVLVATTGM